MQLRDELPLDHHLGNVYRYGAAFCGVVLLVFGSLGLADALSSLNTDGGTIAGMTTNTALSIISLAVGALLIAGGIIGGNVASNLNLTVGGLFLLSGFYHLFVLDKGANFLGFGMTNVVFSFLMGLVIMTFGMYGRVSSKLTHDNPYWRKRHPGQAEREAETARPVLEPAVQSTTAPKSVARRPKRL